MPKRGRPESNKKNYKGKIAATRLDPRDTERLNKGVKVTKKRESVYIREAIQEKNTNVLDD
jgi:predicted DNA-binding protein